eukprot:RCo052075
MAMSSKKPCVSLQVEPADAGNPSRQFTPDPLLPRQFTCLHLPKRWCCGLRRPRLPRCCRHPKAFEVPIWVLLVGLSTLSLVLIGVLAFVLTERGSERAINFVGENYRDLACTAVHSNVIDFISGLVESTRQVAIYASTSSISSVNPAPVELRQLILTRVMTTTGFSRGSFMSVGLASGELLGINVDVASQQLFWEICNSNLTGNILKGWPATEPCSECSSGLRGLWSDDWRSWANETYTSIPYNASRRMWYQDALASSYEVTIGKTFVATMPLGKSALAFPVVAQIRRNNVGPIFGVAVTATTQDHFDNYLKGLSSTLFPGTVSFIVEASTGYLVASSTAGQETATPPNTASGNWTQ